jgi:hypothetical protein
LSATTTTPCRCIFKVFFFNPQAFTQRAFAKPTFNPVLTALLRGSCTATIQRVQLLNRSEHLGPHLLCVIHAVVLLT